MATPDTEEILRHLHQHATRSDERHAELKRQVEEVGDEVEEELNLIKKEKKMIEPMNIFTPATGTNDAALIAALMGNNHNYSGVGAGAGAGLGAGILGGILGGALLGNNGLFGNRDRGYNDAGVVTPALLSTSLAGVTEAQNTSMIQQTLGDIKASIPLAEGQVQLALATLQNDINSNINSAIQTTVAGDAGINQNISSALASSLASQNAININVMASANNVKEAVTNYGVANLNATKDSQFATQVAISNSTKEILAALNEQNTANLQRQLTVAEQALLEQRGAARSRDVEINVSQTVSQNQAQLQAQQQQQQQFQILAQLAANINNLAGDIQAVRQTQSNVNFGVQGNAAQTASAANNRVN